MIRIISNRKEIEKYHNQFHSKLDEFFTEKVNCWVGYPSGSFEDTVKYSDKLNIWISSNEQPNRFWNGFGVGRPRENKNNSLNGEINFPYENINRRIAGVFAVEENGNILVLHRGKIGGGKKGIGKHFFKDNFRGDFVNAIDGNRETEFCLIGELKSNHFPNQVANFIKEIYRVKHLGNDETNVDFDELNNFSFTNEHSGTVETKQSGTKTIDRTHGIIVNALAAELEHRSYKIGNDKNRDLFIHNKSEISALFEIKTSSTTQNLYTAVGQLLIYSIPINNSVKMIAVLPDKLNTIVEKRFNELGIELLYYNWENDVPKFIELDKVLGK